MTFLRYGLPALMFVGALAMLLFGPTPQVALEGFAMGTGSAIALLLMNALWRLGFEGDKERDEEEAARRYLVAHGRWPDE